MRVAVVCGDARPELDGVADYTARLTTELLARDIDVILVTAGPDPDPVVEVRVPANASPAADVPAPAGSVAVADVPALADAAAADGVPAEAGAGAGRVRLPVVVAASRWDGVGVARVARVLRALRPDVVHAQFAPSAFGYRGEVGLLPALLGRAPLVTTVHEYGWWGWGPPAVRGAWDREGGLLIPGAATVVVTNPVHAAALSGSSIRHIPIGPNLRVVPSDRAATRAELGLAADTPVVACFGFVHPVKGIRYLLPALARLRGRHPGAHLLVVGGFASRALPADHAAAFRAELEGRVDALGLGSAVTFTGWRPEAEVSRLLGAADLAVLPFTAGTTTRSGALLACAAHGLPIVATAADPPDPALADGETALLVPVRDTAALATALDRALSDPPLAARLRRGARRLAAAHDWGRIADAHVDLYRTVAA